jgi:hypothetical protein
VDISNADELTIISVSGNLKLLKINKTNL